MARASMANLISLVRDLIGDPGGVDQVFTDDQIERSLDTHRWAVRYERLQALPTMVSGHTEYLDWYSEMPYWEADAALCNGSYSGLAPSSSDPIHGRWGFAAHQDDVLITGKVYDPYGAAADLLEMWQGKTALEYDVDTDGAALKRSQKRAALAALAEQYRRQQRVMTAAQVRSDVW